jgi:methyltransferase family protein
MGAHALYDRIGQRYTTTRRPDPRIAAAILRALGNAESVLNVGAEALPFRLQSFDAALAVLTLHHWSD